MNRKNDNENYGIENTIKIVSAESEPNVKPTGTITLKITDAKTKKNPVNLRKLLILKHSLSRD